MSIEMIAAVMITYIVMICGDQYILEWEFLK